MKPQAIRKRIRQRGVDRLPFTVTIPLSAFPEPCPPFEAPGPVDDGGWLVHENGEPRRWVIYTIGTSRQPGDEVVVQNGATWIIYRSMSSPIGEGTDEDERPIPLHVTEAYAARETWAEKWLHAEDYGACPASDILLRPSFWPKTVWHEFDGDRVRVTYSVKPQYVRQFARDMADAFRMARRANVDLRWVKERR